ncbi:MAG: type II 3-dehydroquinate dehydratase [Bacteroidia bacterium]
MKLLIINGPNLNLLGSREKNIYGTQTFEDFYDALKQKYNQLLIDYVQSNIEGEIINYIQNSEKGYEGIILNAGGYSHTSVAIGDAVAAINTPVVEVHISNILAREEFRHISFISRYAKGVITGFGLIGYELAVQYFLLNFESNKNKF